MLRRRTSAIQSRLQPFISGAFEKVRHVHSHRCRRSRSDYAGRGDRPNSVAVFVSTSLHRVAASFETDGARLLIPGLSRLLLLRRCLLLLICLCGVLTSALPARRGRAHRGTRARVAADHFADNRATRSTPSTSPWRRPGRSRGWGSCRRLRWRIRGVIFALLHGPYVTLTLVLLLLLW